MSSPALEPEGLTAGSVDRDGPPADYDAPSLPLDQVFDVLRNERRRLVLRHLEDNDGPHTIGDLAEEVAAYENEKPIAQLSSSERKRAYVGLYQCHLPKMDSMGVVEFNKNRGRVEAGPNYSLVKSYLGKDAPSTQDDRWPRRYLRLSAVAIVLVTLSTAGSSSLVAVVAAAVVVTFAGVSILHWNLTRAPEDDDTVDVYGLSTHH
jgi:hypothetical protein